MADLRKLADAAADRYGVPRPLFRRLIQQESGWNPNARNPSGATGLVQIHLPSHPDITEEQALDPAFALGWGARYLAAQKERFKRWDLALAAYNAGPGNVASGKWRSFPETRNYVRSIVGGKTQAAAKAAPARAVRPAPPKPAPSVLSDSLLADLFASNNRLIGVDTPDFISGLLASPKLAAPLSAPAPSPPVGAPVPQETPHASGFTPAFKSALDKLLAATGLTVTSGYRSPEHQAELYAAAVKKYGSEQAARKWVAPPGRSKHNEGIAADLGGNLALLNEGVLRRYGLWRPLPHENWHVELLGSRG